MSRQRDLSADDAAEAQAPNKRARSMSSASSAAAAAMVGVDKTQSRHSTPARSALDSFAFFDLRCAVQPLSPPVSVPFGSTLRLRDLVDFAISGHGYQLGRVSFVQPGAVNVGYFEKSGAHRCAVIAVDSSYLAPPLTHSILRNRAQARSMLERVLAQEQSSPQASEELIAQLQTQLQSLKASPGICSRPLLPTPAATSSRLGSLHAAPSYSQPVAAANRISELEKRVVQLESALRQSHEQIAQLQSEVDAAKPTPYDGTVLLDSGATHHSCNDRRLFRTLRSTPPISITGFSGETVTVRQKGEIVLTLMSGGQLVLTDVSFSEQFKDTLISVPQLASDGYHTSFDDKRAILTKDHTACVLARRGHQYLFDIRSPGSAPAAGKQ